MKGLRLATLALVPALGPCGKTTPVPAPVPPRVDTVRVTREVAPPLPEGTPLTICLSTGFPLTVLVAANGDTLIGSQRIRVQQVRPGLVFEGNYAGGRPWLDSGVLTFERRNYMKAGIPHPLKCDDLKEVGAFDGVPLFADLGAPSPVETLLVPLKPGIFQAFRTTLPRRR